MDENAEDKLVRRNYKDSLFCYLFREKENALSLYNALNGSNYTEADSLEIVTLEDAVYLSLKNDCAVYIHSSIALFEQQSSWNPNMPIRGLLYFAAEYSGWLSQNNKDVFSSKLIKIPNPQYFVLYNGERNKPEKVDLKLSEAFEKPAEGYEWTAHVINVNAGCNKEILDRCKVLGEYAQFVAEVRKNRCEGMPLVDAINTAIDSCIGRGILEQFLKKHKAEVMNMVLFEYDEDLHFKTLREEGREEGIYGAVDLLRSCGLADSTIKEKIMEKFSLTESQAEGYLTHGLVTA